jgi:DNA modification methylase
LSETNLILTGDALEMLKTLTDESVQCCVTSPPYWGLRDYGVPGQLGLERTPEEYVEKLVNIFREVRRVLKKDGTVWLNIGDSYCGSTSETPSKREDSPIARGTVLSQEMRAGRGERTRSMLKVGLKPKDLCMIPARVALALQADGWYIRSDIIWVKRNSMPESVTDRPTRAHEYIFLLTKNAKYYYDAEAVKQPLSDSYANDPRHGSKILQHTSLKDYSGEGPGVQTPTQLHDNMFTKPKANGSNLRSWWDITTKPYKGAHFATFPPEIPERCIKAGSRDGDIILDPFGGSGTTARVAKRLGRKYIIIELNPTYVTELIEPSLENINPIFNNGASQGLGCPRCYATVKEGV